MVFSRLQHHWKLIFCLLGKALSNSACKLWHMWTLKNINAKNGSYGGCNITIQQSIQNPPKIIAARSIHDPLTLYYRTLPNASPELPTFLPLLLFFLPSLFCLDEIKLQALTAVLQGRWFQNTNMNNVFKNSKKNNIFKGKTIRVSERVRKVISLVQ